MFILSLVQHFNSCPFKNVGTVKFSYFGKNMQYFIYGNVFIAGKCFQYIWICSMDLQVILCFKGSPSLLIMFVLEQ